MNNFVVCFTTGYYYTQTYRINANQRVFDLEGQAFSRLYDLAPRPPSPVTDDTQEDRVKGENYKPG
jgi:hypothetical protein